MLNRSIDPFVLADPTYFPGRRADILYEGSRLGTIGVVHPEVLGKFGVPFPTSALEIDVERFL
jgi:phenylalanyl-tRNA synthetase beta chain